MEALIALVLLGLAVAYWTVSLAIREQVLKTCKRMCRQVNVQLLEESVVCTSLWPARDVDGRMRLQRRYGFEFSADGADRRHGDILVLGRAIAWIRLEHPDGVIFESDPI